ncbi:hypothetical protein AJ80_00374 [Polytolypa hystricis UAMH7299]|uniref:Eukaryotic translation initiation factor 3 subunit M n=1 Tax=Polytolypa hystricis (strain UAMH7299) TaxID=1447883 RepID=A0A2B7YUS4_POLH7|nr:hypothetical protein AJ80_00374 [Polytolypa hystricis UAMH7299]
MSLPSNTLLIEGTFSELADEFAQYIDSLRKSNEPTTPSPASVHADVSPGLQKLREKEADEEEPSDAEKEQIFKQRDEVLKKLVLSAPALNSAPEKEITAAYSLLIHLIRQSSSVDMFLPRICTYLSKPFVSSPQHGAALALSILSTVFNSLAPSNSVRYHVFLAILAVIRTSSSNLAWDALKTQLANQLVGWILEWDLDEEETQKLHLAISDAAKDAGDKEFSYTHLLAALQAIPPADASAQEAREIAQRALTAALVLPSVFDFTPLTASDAIQALRSSDATLFELLEVFAADTLDAYEDFIATTPLSSIHDLSSSADILKTKMRLLTLASLAASTPSRSLSYSSIVNALRIESADVEKWVIDTIRAGLIEGKLSQLKGEFLVHRATYRVFGEKQWAEVQGRLMVWRQSLENVLDVVRAEREKFVREGISGAQATAHGNAGAFEGGQGRGGDRRRGGGRGQQREMELVSAD